METEIIQLGQKVCESCNGFCLNIIDIYSIIFMTFIIYKIGEVVFSQKEK